MAPSHSQTMNENALLDNVVVDTIVMEHQRVGGGSIKSLDF